MSEIVQTHRRVFYHDANGGEHQTKWPFDIQPTRLVEFSGRTYEHAGTQDGVAHYREIVAA